MGETIEEGKVRQGQRERRNGIGSEDNEWNNFHLNFSRPSELV
jgi:hypothetical protein